jgi:glycosyltransferase involved in cell wall biosynthesis
MRILVLSNLYPPDFLGGYELGCRQAADALAESGHDVLILTSAPRLPVPPESHVRRALQLTDTYDPYLQSKHHVVTLGLQHASARYVNAFNVHVLLETLASFEPDVVYAWNLVGLGGLGLMVCLQRLSVPWVWHLMDKVPRDLCRLPFVEARSPLARLFSLHLEGTYLVCSRRVVEEIDDPEPILRGTVELVPNWIVGHRPPARTRFFSSTRLRVVSAAGHLCAPKGVEQIIDAARLLRQRGRCTFVIDLYGKVIDDTYPALIRRHDLGTHVRLMGLRSQTELAELYREYDVFAFPTWEREPFGFAPLEAAAAGCVPIITNNCGIGEWLVGGVHCWKIERDADALADALADVLDGRIDVAAIGQRVEDVVWRDFHLHHVLPCIERALVRAARQRRSPVEVAQQTYHLAILAEKLTQVLIEEWLAS